jgi:spore coat polysaccharide biosynthesis protein SpsF
MKIVTIIQARMGSTRLPGKVLKDIGGRTVLARVVNRVRRAMHVGEVVIATTSNPGDDVIADECGQLSVECFRGDEFDVLDRYYRAALAYGAGTIVRICADCPMIEPETTDIVIREFLHRGCDYASNALTKTYPRGLDTEIMTADALARAWREAQHSYQRAHVTPYIYEHPDKFNIVRVMNPCDYSHYRWTLDTAEDLAFIRAVYQHFDNDDRFYWRNVIALLESEPVLAELNSQVAVKALQEG